MAVYYRPASHFFYTRNINMYNPPTLLYTSIDKHLEKAANSTEVDNARRGGEQTVRKVDEVRGYCYQIIPNNKDKYLNRLRITDEAS